MPIFLQSLELPLVLLRCLPLLIRSGVSGFCKIAGARQHSTRGEGKVLAHATVREAVGRMSESGARGFHSIGLVRPLRCFPTCGVPHAARGAVGDLCRSTSWGTYQVVERIRQVWILRAPGTSLNVWV